MDNDSQLTGEHFPVRAGWFSPNHLSRLDFFLFTTSDFALTRSYMYLSHSRVHWPRVPASHRVQKDPRGTRIWTSTSHTHPHLHTQCSPAASVRSHCFQDRSSIVAPGAVVLLVSQVLQGQEVRTSSSFKPSRRLLVPILFVFCFPGSSIVSFHA